MITNTKIYGIANKYTIPLLRLFAESYACSDSIIALNIEHCEYESIVKIKNKIMVRSIFFIIKYNKVRSLSKQLLQLLQYIAK